MRLFLTYILIFFMALRAVADVPAKYQPDLAMVDSALVHQHEYVAQLEEQISVLRSQLRTTGSDEQRYVLCDLLSQKFYYLNSDSALYYLGQKEALGEKYQRADWKNEVLLSRGNLYTQIGLLTRGEADLNAIKPQELTDGQKGTYYSMLIFQETQKSRLSGTSSQLSSQLTDSLKKYAPYGDEMAQYWSMFFTYQEPDRSQKLLESITQIYQRMQQQKSQISGRAAFMAAANYGEAGDEDHRMEYLCRSAADNISFVNRDHTALLSLISYLIEQDDVERSSEMGQYMEQIYSATQRLTERQQRLTRHYLYALVALLVVLLAALFLLVRSLRRQRRQQTALSESNAQLSESITRLTETQRQLQESNVQVSEVNRQLGAANYIKEQYIGSLFSTCSEYINKLDSFRQDINRKIKAGQVEDVLRQTRAENSKTRDEVKELNKTFDATFLSIYPDFVADFQTLLTDDEPLATPKHGLNTELRIYALVWLGISSSVKIAELLHLSAQTVYNARQKMRSRSLQPCATAEEFAAIVQALGRGKIAVNP